MRHAGVFRGRTWVPALLILILHSPLRAQDPDSLAVVPDTVPPDTSQVDEGISPGGAFLRSALLPGWGHAEVGSYVRGGFYVAVESAAAFMIFKTQTRLSRVRDRLDLMERVARARLEAEGITDPATIENALENDTEIEDLRALESSRSEQREDWLALGIFFLFLGGADAYVSAHLAEIPAALNVEGTPSEGMELSISIPLTLF